MVRSDYQGFLDEIQAFLDGVVWVFPAGCDERCRENLGNFVARLKRDLEEKLTIVYITDIGMNKNVWSDLEYDSIRELNERFKCSDTGSKRYYIPFPGRSLVTAARIFYMSSSGELEQSTRILGLEPHDDLFPEPCIMTMYDGRLNPCCSFGDNDTDIYQFILNDIAKEYGLEGLDILGDNDEDYYKLQEYSIPPGMSLYILFSTTCIKNVNHHIASKKYIIGGYRVGKIYVQKISRPLTRYLVRLYKQIIRSIKELDERGLGNEVLRVLATEDVYTLFNIVSLLIERSEIAIPLGETDTCFFGEYFMNNPCYAKRSDIEPYIQNEIEEFRRRYGKYPSKKEYYRLLLRSSDYIPKYDHRKNRKIRVRPNSSYAILIGGPKIRMRKLKYSFGRELLEEIIRELEKALPTQT